MVFRFRVIGGTRRTDGRVYRVTRNADF